MLQENVGWVSRIGFFILKNVKKKSEKKPDKLSLHSRSLYVGGWKQGNSPWVILTFKSYYLRNFVIEVADFTVM